jgi:hypothetical protein
MSLFYPDDDAIERLALGVLDRTTPKPEWTHAAHFATTLWLMRRRPAMDLVTEMPAVIRAYNEATGVPNTDTEGYHETITQASLRMARAFLAARPMDEPLHEVVDALMASPLGRSDWILAYWTKDVLFSPHARRVWTEPDLKPLPVGSCDQ